MSRDRSESSPWVKKFYINWAAREFIRHSVRHGHFFQEAYQAEQNSETEKQKELEDKAKMELQRARNVVEFMKDLGGQRIVDDLNLEIFRRITPTDMNQKKI